jgi:hypothetical protein
VIGVEEFTARRRHEHYAAWPEREDAGDDERAEEQAKHGIAVPRHPVGARMCQA